MIRFSAFIVALCAIYAAFVYGPVAAVFLAALMSVPLLPFAQSYRLGVNPALQTYNADGGVAFGAQDVVIGGVTWTVDALSMERMSTWIVTKNSVSRPNKQAGQEEVPLIPITLQWVGATSGTQTDGTGIGSPTVVPPAMFANFTVLIGGVNITVIIEKVGLIFTNAGESKINIGCRYRLT